jgi:transcription antitermination factor NusG
MSIKFYDLIGELGTLTLDGSANPTAVQFIDTGLLLNGYRPFTNNVSIGDLLYIKIQQTAQNAYAVVIATYNIDSFGYRTLYVERILAKYGTLVGGTYGEVTVFNDAATNHRVSANELITKNSSFSPEIQTSDYVVSLSGTTNVTLPQANIYTDNIKYGFLVSSKYSGSDVLNINASGSNNIIINGGTSVSSISLSGVGSYLELAATSGGSWYKLFSTESLAGETAGSVVGGTNNSLQFNKNSVSSGGKAFWDNDSKTLYFGENNNILNADVVLSSSQIKSSGIYPLSIKLNSGNFFAVTKDGKVAINTPSLPLYESSPNFHMVGRCAVFEGTCGSAGVALTLFNNPDVVPAIGSVGGSFNMSARNSNRNVINYAQIQSKILNPNKGQSSGQFLVNVDVSGSPYNVMKLDLANLELGKNQLSSSTEVGVFGKDNTVNKTTNSKILGDDNTLDHVNDVYMLGSNNSIDFIKNSAKYNLSEANISVLSGLDWNDLDDLQSGDIVQVSNNNVLNGYYIANEGLWTAIDETVAVGYYGTSNFVIGSDSTLSGNNIIVVGSDISASGNNLSVFGNLNNIKTQKISDIVRTNSTSDYSTIVGNVNTFDASGLIVFGNRNTGSGINALMLNGSLNTIGSGTINSVILGNNNNVTVVSGLSVGNNNFGLSSLSTLIGSNNTINLLNSIAVGSQIIASGNNLLAVGTNVRTSGINNVVVGNSGLLIGSSGTIVGNSVSATGNNILGVGSNIQINGSDNVVLGYNNQLTGQDNLLVGANAQLSGIFTESTIYGLNNTFDNTNYKYSTFVGQNNTVSSGVNNGLLIGTNSSIRNIYNTTLPAVPFIVTDDGTKFTSVGNSGLIINFRPNDRLLYSVGTTVVGSGIVQSSYAILTDLIVEPVVAFTDAPTINVLSVTKQDEIISKYSRPVINVGNDNTITGFSGLVVGHGVSVRGYDNTILGSDNVISGNRNILLTNNYSSSGLTDHIDIGFNNLGGLANSTMIGSNNEVSASGNIVIGNSNTINGDTQVFGSDNFSVISHSQIIGKENTVIAKGQRLNIPVVYDDRNRYDFTGVDHTIIGSGTYSTTYQCLLLDNDVSWQYSRADKATVQIYDNNIALPTYIGNISKDPEIVNGFKGIFFDTYYPGNDQQIVANRVAISTFIEEYYPNQIPTTLTFKIAHYNDGAATINGSDNLIIGSTHATIAGSNNQIGIDWKDLKDVVSASGFIVGQNNQVYKPLTYRFNAQGVAEDIKPEFPSSESLFQAALGFDLKNTDPNSIKIGFDTNAIKVFDLGGKKNATKTVITNPNASPPATESIAGELVGTGIYVRGVVINSDSINNSFNILNDSKTKPSVLSVISSGNGYVGINTNYPQNELDVNGTISSSKVLTKVVDTDRLVLQSGSAPGYFLTATDKEGNAEWVAGIKVDVSGYPGTLVYYSGTPATGGKVQPISSTAIVQNKEWQLNTMIYEPSGCNIIRSGLLFDQFMNVDKYAVMTLDEHRRSVNGYPIEDVEKLLAVNPGRIDYIQKLIDLAEAKQKSDSSHFIPRQYNALYFIPESSAYITPSDVISGSNSSFKLNLQKAGQAQQSVFSIGRRKLDYSQPVDLDKGEDVDPANRLFPGGLSSPQILLSTIPKKDFAGKNSYVLPNYKFNYDEMVSPYMAPYIDPNGNDFNIIKPMTGGTFEGKQYQSWWFYDQTASASTTNPGSIPLEGRYSTIQRSVPTAFNLGRDEIDFAIYGTGSKYPRDIVSKFLFGDVSQYAEWKKAGLGREDAGFPFLTTIPAFYFNSSINSFMIHTDRPSWIPEKVPANVCEPCDPIQSGINFADLTVRGWIGTSGIRVGQGFRRALTTDTEGKLIEAVDSNGKPIFETTQGMVLMSDIYGLATWTPLGGATSSNVTLTAETQGLGVQNIQLTEGPLDPVNIVSNTAFEGLDSDTARLYRDNINITNENVTANPVLRLRGVTRNSLLFAKNPLPNRDTEFTNKFNESSLPSNSNEMNIDGTENLFYYGYTNALAGVLDFNNESQTTEIVIDGDATRRFNVGDIVRIYYKYMAELNGQFTETSIIERAKVVGLTTTYLAQSLNNRSNRTTVVLDKTLNNVADSTYLLDSSTVLRKVAIISESIGGYLTFNFPGTTPDTVISNRENIDTSFNANGKNINFAVYGSVKKNIVPSLILAEQKTNTVQINSKIPFIYGFNEKTLTQVTSELEKNINSELYYEYNLYGDYLLGDYSESDSKISGSTTDIQTGDIVEIIYDTYQDIKAIVKSVNASGILISFKDINLGMVENKIGNISRGTNGSIINSKIKYRVIKRQLAKTTKVVDGVVSVGAKDSFPEYAQFSVRGLTYTDGLMIGSKDNSGKTIIEDQSLLFSDRGLVSGSNLKYFSYKAPDQENPSKHLIFNHSALSSSLVTSLREYRDKPDQPISETNPVKHAPVFADFTMVGNTKITSLYVDNLKHFRTIDGGVVKFRGKCNNQTNVCAEGIN